MITPEKLFSEPIIISSNNDGRLLIQGGWTLATLRSEEGWEGKEEGCEGEGEGWEGEGEGWEGTEGRAERGMG